MTMPMTIRNLTQMFKPQSLALVGASTHEGSVGHMLMKNVVSGKFSGPVWPVNPAHDVVEGVKAYRDIKSLPSAPDLAVLTIASSLVTQTIAELGALGTRAAVVISAGFNETGAEGKKLEQQMLEAAKPYNLRIIGPNCLGIIVPGSSLNASFSHIAASPGKLAFVSQSGAMCTTILDRVAERDIGFSHFISLGNCSDVDFGDMLEYLADDVDTSAILLYIESVSQVQKFMAAGKRASRKKPIIVIKSGRNKEGASSHTGALVGSDGVYDVAFKRAGMLRVYDMEELFDAVETLARLKPAQPTGLAGDGHMPRLLIVSNGGGPAVLATDYLMGQGGKLAELSKDTVDKLNAVLPPTWSHGNPVDIIGDANGKRYAGALSVATGAPEADAVFVMNCPTAVSDNVECAKAVIDNMRSAADKNIFTCWLGEATAHEPRRLFAEANIPTYDTPEKAVRAFLHMAEYRHNQAILMQEPPACKVPSPGKGAVDTIIANAFAQGRNELFESEAKEVFSLYGIPVVKTYVAKNADEAVILADKVGYPVVLKILSPDISHKSDVGGVILSLGNADAVRHAAETMTKNVAKLKPGAKLEGFTVQQMVAKREGYELIVGMSTDRQFGPVIMFGEGGVAVEVIDDHALGLPPLDTELAFDMIRRTRVYKRLLGFRDHKPVNMDTIIDVLVRVSQLVSEVGDISEIDINPLIADEHGAIALDARIKLVKSTVPVAERLAIICS